MRILLTFCLLLTSFAHAQILIKNTTVIDVENKKLLPQQDVLVENGKIITVGKNLKSPSAQQVDGSGKYLAPGLVDAHVHFFQNGRIYA